MSLLDNLYGVSTTPQEYDELEAALQEAYEAGINEGYQAALNELSEPLIRKAAFKAKSLSDQAKNKTHGLRANNYDLRHSPLAGTALNKLMLRQGRDNAHQLDNNAKNKYSQFHRIYKKLIDRKYNPTRYLKPYGFSNNSK